MNFSGRAIALCAARLCAFRLRAFRLRPAGLSRTCGLAAWGLAACGLPARGLNWDLPAIAARLRYGRGNFQHSVFESGFDLVRIYPIGNGDLAVKLAVASFAAVNAPAIFFVLAASLAFNDERVIAKLDLHLLGFQAREFSVNDIVALPLGDFDRGRPDAA